MHSNFLTRALGVAVLFGTTVLLSACAGTFPDARPDRPPAANQVVLIGEVVFDPPIRPTDSADGTADPFNTLKKVVLGFAYDPRKPVDLTSSEVLPDEYAWFTFGEPFALVAPRRVVYLRALRASVREAVKGTGMYMSASGPTLDKAVSIEALICTGALKIDAPPDASYVYIGRIVCHHKPLPDAPAKFEADPHRVFIPAREQTNWTVEDRLGALLPKLPVLIGDHVPTRALPEEVSEPSP